MWANQMIYISLKSWRILLMFQRFLVLLPLQLHSQGRLRSVHQAVRRCHLQHFDLSHWLVISLFDEQYSWQHSHADSLATFTYLMKPNPGHTQYYYTWVGVFLLPFISSTLNQNKTVEVFLFCFVYNKCGQRGWRHAGRPGPSWQDSAKLISSY